MAAASFAAGAVSLCLTTTLPWPLCLLAALTAAPFSAFTELLSHNGSDTVSVPVVTAAVLFFITGIIRFCFP